MPKLKKGEVKKFHNIHRITEDIESRRKPLEESRIYDPKQKSQTVHDNTVPFIRKFVRVKSKRFYVPVKLRVKEK